VKKQPVNFYSEGVRLVGDIYYPDDATPSDTRAGIVPCHGYTGVKDIYLPDNARVLTEAGYVVLTFDYKGWGDSEGSRSRLAPYSRVADVQAALTFLGTVPEVDAGRLGIYGTSYGGATVVWTGAIDARVKCVVSVVGIGNGARWMRSVRRPDEFHDLLERSEQDRVKRVLDGQSEFVKREPRPVLFITTDDDRLVPPEESIQLYARAGEPKKLVMLHGYGHYEVYMEPAFGEVMQATLAWYRQYLPARNA
jgi:dipeptidyl aminopeptidase/acylaminoacyl peptidase